MNPQLQQSCTKNLTTGLYGTSSAGNYRFGTSCSDDTLDATDAAGVVWPLHFVNGFLAAELPPSTYHICVVSQSDYDGGTDGTTTCIDVSLAMGCVSEISTSSIEELSGITLNDVSAQAPTCK